MCHMCGFIFKNDRISQHYRRHHKIEDPERLREVKADMKKLSAEFSERRVLLLMSKEGHHHLVLLRSTSRLYSCFHCCR